MSVAVVALLVGCAQPSGGDLDLAIGFANEGLAAEVVSIRVSVVERCEGITMGEDAPAGAVSWTVNRVGGSDPTPELSGGRRAIYAVGMNAECQIVAAGCVAANMGAEGDSRVSLELDAMADARELCRRSETCVDGRCEAVETPPDGLDTECGADEIQECDLNGCGGVRTCVDGTWAEECVVPNPGEEVCDGADNDCDGTRDEGFEKNACGTCGDAPVETCNGIDDDCDGFEDDGVVNRCGECGEEPAEICNALDDDCDGETDEGLRNACGTCGPAPTEVCDNADNDCDGLVDEGMQKNACGTCGAAPTEVCDGADNDCDGQVDEGVKNSCGGCGEVGVEVCDNVDNDCDGTADEGFPKNACGTCGAAPTETCDAKDNDCDGQVDEGVKNACGTCGAVPTEICDGRDNDCDGQVDEGVKNACGGCGAVPVEICDNVDNDCDGQTDEGVPKNACGTCGAAPVETCDGKDNDCDGKIDDGVTNACGTCGAVPKEAPNGTDDDCDGTVDEGFWFTPIKITWAAFKAHNFGCDTPFSPWWQCQQVADSECKNRGYLGGYGPVDWDDGATTGAWIQCIGHGSGARISRVTPATLDTSFADLQNHRAEEKVRLWCAGQGYGATAGTVRWYNNSTVDVICLPSSFGTYREVSAQWLIDRGCGDYNALGPTPICARAAHLTCRDAFGGQHGVGPLWVWGNTGLICIPDNK